MLTRIVNVKALNLRSEPRVAEDTLIDVLHLGQAVDVVGQADRSGWVLVNVFTGSTNQTGVVAERFLRPPVSNAREALINVAIQEWRRFKEGTGQEYQFPYFSYVGEMWNELGIRLDGRDRDIPWSAAAISFMVKRAGQLMPESLYPRFQFSAAHSRYIRHSIDKREIGDVQTPFWGFDIFERRPQLGDLVCRWREEPVTFDKIKELGFFKSHCDLIVGLSNEGILAIGGNVGHSVNVTEYDLTPDGYLNNTNQVFALLANRNP